MSEALRVELLSETTFSSGTGTAGEVDLEVVHDRYGCPFLPARTLKGLLRESWLAMAEHFPQDAAPAREVLGIEADLSEAGVGRLELADAVLPEALRAWVRYAIERPLNRLRPEQVLLALTAMRRQTARDRSSGGPASGTLRRSRVALRGLVFSAALGADGLGAEHWRVLARICLGVRHAGLDRNRGRGRVSLRLFRGGGDVTESSAQLDD